MRAAVLSAPGIIDLVEHPEAPAPGYAQVLVAVRRVGICGTDYHAFGGTQNFISYPCVLGHELAVDVRCCPTSPAAPVPRAAVAAPTAARGSRCSG